jgi:glycosyltransferase involved in cell wall biosynthesis
LGRYDVSIVTSGHDVADARLHREVAALCRAGLTVEVLGLGDAGNAPPGSAARTRPRGGLRQRAVAAAVTPWRARGRVLICLDPDIVPSAMARRLAGRRVVVDVHEDYLALLTDRPWAHGPAGAVGRALARLSTRLAAHADLTVVADDHVPPSTARHRIVVKNLPDPSMLPAPKPRDPAPRAVYIGDIRGSRGLFTMLRAIEAADDWSLDLVGPVAPSDRAALDTWLAHSLAADRVRLHGRLEPRQAWSLAEGAWAGLALLDATPAYNSAVPTKVYEYLACGLAVVSTPLPAMRAVLDDARAGAFVADAAEAARVLTDWAENPSTVDELAANAIAWSRKGEHNLLPYDDLAAHVAALARRA